MTMVHLGPIGIVGGGTVGGALARALAEWADVRVYDTDARKGTHSQEDAVNCPVVFVCLPTPARQGPLGEMDLHSLRVFFHRHRGTAASPNDTAFALRSTVPVGTTRHLAEEYHLRSLVYVPEFLTARCADVGAALPARLVVGGAGPGAYAVARLLAARWPHVPVVGVPAEVAEMAKLATNAFFAAKVAYFNEIYSGCRAMGLDYEAVRRVVAADPRVGDSHTHVPGPDGRRGYGGACLPKDAAALLHQLAGLSGVTPMVTGAVVDRNRVVDRPAVPGEETEGALC